MLKTRIIASIFLFLSAYSPLWGIFLIQDLNFETWKLSHPVLIWTGIGISFIACILVFIAVNTPKVSVPPVKVLKASNRSGDLLNYSIPYMVSFFALELDNLNSLLSYLFFMLILFLITYKTQSIFSNPILALMGFNLFDLVIEKIEYDNNHKEKRIKETICCLAKNGRPEKDDECRIIELSESIALITERNPKI